MGLYDKYILPRLLHLACTNRAIMRQREKVVPLAHGQVLEIGLGSGLNLPYYDASKVSKLWGLEPSLAISKMAQKNAQSANFDVEFIGLPAEEIPLETNGIDSILMTYTLCTIADFEVALGEMVRVLKQGGELIFCEHGVAPDANVQRWQNRINPTWKRFSGGCNLNRDIPALIEQGGFRIKGMKARYIPGWKPAGFNYWGTATQVSNVSSLFHQSEDT